MSNLLQFDGGARRRRDLDAELDHRFAHHPPSPERGAAHQRIRVAGREFVAQLMDLVPECDELRRAVDAVDDAVMRANAGLARRSEA